MADYLTEYINAYRKEFQQATAVPPNGGGLPNVPVSPYLEVRSFKCLLAKDGVIIFLDDKEPEHRWEIAGGPALKVDYDPTITPSWVEEALEKNGLTGKNIGIYRIVSKNKIPESIWSGQLPASSVERALPDGTSITIFESTLGVEDALSLLTFGGFGRVLNLHLEESRRNFWEPHILAQIGSFRADMKSKRFLNYAETHPHRNIAAWDTRSIKLRAKSDVGRDFARCSGSRAPKGGFLMMSSHHQPWVENYQRSLHVLSDAIEKFDQMLRFQSGAKEAVFHKFLEDNPILLDVYGIAITKPKFRYPEGSKSAVGKSYVEPDFIISYANSTYKLIELERASKKLGTKAGHARQDLAQAAFQIAEWKDFIATNYSEIQSQFPNISENCPSLIILSLDTVNECADVEELRKKIALYKRQLAVDEIWTYDDLLNNARMLYAGLLNLAS